VERCSSSFGVMSSSQRSATANASGWFNETRLHSELGDRTPPEVEAAHYGRLAQANAA
jgi:transposase InsO family protein